jgi:hypothetical protein
MPSNCNSKHTTSNCIKSCVEREIKTCKEKCCKAKYVKLAEKLLKTGLLVDSCTYNKDVFTNVVAGSKFNWLNDFLINNADIPIVSSDLVPASFGSENAFRTVDPSLNNYVFAIQLTEDIILNPTTGTENSVPLLQDVFQSILGVDNFGTVSLADIIATGSDAAAAYATSYIVAVKQMIAQLPSEEVIIGAVGVPLFAQVNYSILNVNGVDTDNFVAKVGIIKIEYENSGTNTEYIIYGLGHTQC